MKIKKIDFLSPKITLFYYGSKRHRSVVGAIMTLLMALLSTSYIFYLISSIISHKISNFMFYKSYLTDAGLYLFNDITGIYHYFLLHDGEKNEYRDYDPKYLRIFMSRLYKTYKTNEESLSDNEHWVYDTCREGIDNENINKEVFNEETYFNKGACLRYYFNNNKKKYFPIEDKNNFKYPYLTHGSGRKENLFLETIIEKCDNSSIISKIIGPCAKQEEIDKYIKKQMGIILQLLERQVITSNYNNPIYEYISGISGNMDSDVVPTNNINLAPFYIDIQTGVFLPKSQKIMTYYLENNQRTTWDNTGNKNILAIFDYWLENSGHIMKGGYSTFYDILPSIGGIIQLIYYIFYVMNYFYNKFIIMHDCNKSFFRMYNLENNRNTPDKNKFFKCIKSIREEALKKYKNDHFKRHSFFVKKKKTDSSNEMSEINKSIKKNKLKSVKTEINSNNNFLNYLNNRNKLTNMSNSKDLMISFPNNNIIYNNTNNINIINNNKKEAYTKKNIEKIIHKKKDDILSAYFHDSDKENSAYYQFSHQLKEFLYHKRKAFKIESLNEKILNKYLTFFNYLLSFTGNEFRKRGFLVLNKFREKLLGEEHLFRTNIFLYHLEKYFNIKETQKIDIFELYENL